MNGLITNYYHKYQKITQEDENIPDVIPAKEFSLNQANDINFFNDMNHRQIQQHKINAQNEQLEKIGGSIKVLKDMSHQISGELDHQSVILDEFSKDLDHTESRMDMVMKKMAKTMKISSDKKQWWAIAILSLVLFILFILFFL
ncbi:unnamed protein product [Gordionus sp. m RMFG-2023]|uniref:syntaxin-6-like isoform X1 n=1 Tax=Gordionus sp. m RMFG-2023 TaxID=3053472 RepID=UPI0030DEA3CE